MKNILLLVFTFFLLSACAGTEVGNPPNPDSISIKAIEFKTPVYHVGITIPEGWTYIEYGPAKIPGPEAFQDINSETIVVATFSKKQSRFTTFFSKKRSDQTLLQFVRERRPAGLIDIKKVKNPANNGETFQAIFNQAGPGPNGGLVFDAYFAKGDEIFWLRAELVGTPAEQSKDLDEMNQILETLVIF